MAEEIILLGKYKDFSLDANYLLDGATEEDVLYVLSALSDKIDSYAYAFAGIKNSKINEFVDKIANGSGLSSLISILESLKPTELKEALLEASNKDKSFLPIAESYFIHSLLNKLNVPFKLSSSQFNSSIKPKNTNDGGKIVFVVNYKNWMVIKKLKLENVKDYEVSAILSSINFTIVHKMFDFAKAADESLVNTFVIGKRKSLGALAEALKGITESEEKKKAYLVCMVCEKLGYRPYSSPHMLEDAYPDIKSPKVKGRKPK